MSAWRKKRRSPRAADAPALSWMPRDRGARTSLTPGQASATSQVPSVLSAVHDDDLAALAAQLDLLEGPRKPFRLFQARDDH